MHTSSQFDVWKLELLVVGNIVQDADSSVTSEEAERRFNRYIELLEELSGSEGYDYVLAILQSIQADADYGAYQTAERVAYRFGEEQFCRALLHELPRLIGTLPDWAGDFLVSIANAEDTPYQSILDCFNRLLSESDDERRSIIRDFISQEEDDGWLAHRVGVLGAKG